MITSNKTIKKKSIERVLHLYFRKIYTKQFRTRAMCHLSVSRTQYCITKRCSITIFKDAINTSGDEDVVFHLQTDVIPRPKSVMEGTSRPTGSVSAQPRPRLPSSHWKRPRRGSH